MQGTKLKHEIIGAYGLYPGRPEPHLCKEYDESILRENIGAIPLLPGHLEQLERRLDEILGKRDAHAHLDAAISTRGTSFIVDGIPGTAEDLTLYGTTHGDSSPKTGWVKSNRKYPYPCSEAEKHGIHGLADARRKKILVLLAPPRGVKTAQAEVHLVSEVRLATADELKEMGYPSPGNPTYWLFSWKS